MEPDSSRSQVQNGKNLTGDRRVVGRLFKHAFVTAVLAAALSVIPAERDAYALNKIRYVRINNEYHPLVGKVDASLVNFRPANSGYELAYEFVDDPAEVDVGENYLVKFHLTCTQGYLFTDIKEASCQIQGDPNSYLKEMTVSDDGYTLDLTFDMSPLKMQLEAPENLAWDGDAAVWDEVPYAAGYKVWVATINDRGGLNKQSNVSTAENRISLRSSMYSKTGDYVFLVKALPKSEDYYLSASEESVLEYGNSKMITKSDVGFNDGYFTKDSKGNTSYVRGSKRLASGDYLIEGYVYRFDDAGYMMRGFQNISGVLYYYSDSGQLLYGWFQDNGHWYYANENGVIQTGFADIDGKTFYLDPVLTGRMVTGWKQIQGKTYYFMPDGSMLRDKLIDENKTVSIFDSDGALVRQYKAQ